MIRLVTDEALPLLGEFCRRTPFGCKIAGAADAYGTRLPFARFWLQYAGERPVAAVSALDGAAVLDAGETADFPELADFLRAAGCKSLLCDEAAARLLGFAPDRTGIVLRYAPCAHAPVPRDGVEENPGIREVHALLCACDMCPPDFEPFYLDLSHRIRHGAALCVGVRREGRLAACAVAQAKTERMAVLSAVATDPAFRRRGLGTLAVRALLDRLPQPEIFLLRGQRENEAFYRSLRFLSCGAWAEIDWTETS